MRRDVTVNFASLIPLTDSQPSPIPMLRITLVSLVLVLVLGACGKTDPGANMSTWFAHLFLLISIRIASPISANTVPVLVLSGVQATATVTPFTCTCYEW